MARRAGILLHPTSLPSPYGVGDLGAEAHRFLEQLVQAGQSLWQILPLGPTDPEGSPYNGFSAFGGHGLLIAPDRLVRDGLLEEREAEALAGAPGEPFSRVWERKRPLLEAARSRLDRRADLAEAFQGFRERSAGWLEELALFLALKERNQGRPWWELEPALARREPAALEEARAVLADRMEQQRFVQFLFFRQWGELRARARELGIRIIGDVPIFVAADSVDVWSRPELFHLDQQRRPTCVSGVPPDYFSETGQLWGNPLYRWDVMARDGYAWWKERLANLFELADMVRLDHFRGFQAYWEIPAGARDARGGRWVEGPGAAFLGEIREAFGDLPIIAEDLGVITPEVVALKERFGLPGMLILHFAFGSGPENPYLPHNHTRNAVLYTGTHDNDTTLGWYGSLDDGGRAAVDRYLGPSEEGIGWRLIRTAYHSVADTVILPLQDVLGLGPEGRMNVPGTPYGNWAWRITPGLDWQEAAARLAGLAEACGR